MINGWTQRATLIAVLLGVLGTVGARVALWGRDTMAWAHDIETRLEKIERRVTSGGWSRVEQDRWAVQLGKSAGHPVPRVEFEAEK